MPQVTWKGHRLYLGSIFVGQVLAMPLQQKTWRAWIMTDEDGESIGDAFRSDIDAMIALEKEALRLIARPAQ